MSNLWLYTLLDVGGIAGLLWLIWYIRVWDKSVILKGYIDVHSTSNESVPFGRQAGSTRTVYMLEYGFDYND
jgi:hypothetical protein